MDTRAEQHSAPAAPDAGAARPGCAPRSPPMPHPPVTRKLTPRIRYRRIMEDMTPVLTTVCAPGRYDAARRPRVRPGIPEDTAPTSQVLVLQGVRAGILGKGQKIDGRTWHALEP